MCPVYSVEDTPNRDLYLIEKTRMQTFFFFLEIKENKGKHIVNDKV